MASLVEGEVSQVVYRFRGWVRLLPRVGQGGERPGSLGGSYLTTFSTNIGKR